MTRFSDAVREHDDTTQRRLYSLFTRAVKRGDVPALKIVDTMTVIGRDAQPRQRQDFFIPTSAADTLTAWVDQHREQTPTRRGLTVDQVQQMDEADVMTLIEQQNRPRVKRATTKRKPKTE